MTTKTITSKSLSTLINGTVCLSGMTLPTFNRILDTLEDEGVVEYNGYKLTSQYLRSTGRTYSVEIPQRTRRVVAY